MLLYDDGCAVTLGDAGTGCCDVPALPAGRRYVACAAGAPRCRDGWRWTGVEGGRGGGGTGVGRASRVGQKAVSLVLTCRGLDFFEAAAGFPILFLVGPTI